nr:hypothetical protein [Sphingomonas sp. Y57]
MTAFSLGTVWEETIAFLRRESGLLIPVALAVYGPAQLLFDGGMQAAMAMRSAGEAVPSWQALLVLPGGLLMLLGNLAVSLLVLAPGISVGEALAAALRRLPTALGAMLLLGVAVLAVMLAIVVAATLGAITFKADPRSPVLASQLLVLIMIPIGLLWLRLLLLPTVIAVEPRGAIDAIRRAWQLGRNNALRLFGVWLLLLFLSIVLAVIEMFVVGSLSELLKLAIGDTGLASAIGAIANAALEALLSMGFAVYLAQVYRTLASS